METSKGASSKGSPLPRKGSVEPDSMPRTKRGAEEANLVNEQALSAESGATALDPAATQAPGAQTATPTAAAGGVTQVMTGPAQGNVPLVGQPSNLDLEAQDGSERDFSTHWYLHVRHFTKTTHDALALEAIIWFEDGVCKGPYRLHEHAPNAPATVRLNKPLKRHEIVGRLEDVTLPTASPVAFLQLRKRTSCLTSAFQLEEDIFIQDAYIKRGAHKNPSDPDIQAYFRFTGFLVNKTNIVLPNVISHLRQLTVGNVRQHPINANTRIQERLLPVVDWANVEATQAYAYRFRTIVDAAGLGYGRSFLRILVDTIGGRNKPLLTNLVLSLHLDIARYMGTPGFARLPPGDFTFSALKYAEFVEGNSRPLPAADQFISGMPSPWAMSLVDFTQFLRDNIDRSSEREIADVSRIVQNYQADEEFGRQITEGLFCTQIYAVPPPSGEEFRSAASKSYLAGDVPSRPAWLDELIAEAKPASDARLFYMNYDCLVGVPRNQDANGYFAPARCLLAHDGTHLKPIAISLFYCNEYHPADPLAPGLRDDDPEALRTRLMEGVWRTHLPSHQSWSVAKLFCKCAAGQHHQIVAHALYTHLVIEPFAVALERIVPLDHILYRLLKTHFRYTLDVNFKARTALINKGGVFDQFISTGGIHAGHLQFMVKCYNEWTAEKMVLPAELRSRGFVEDPRDPERCELPEYRYAQDAMAIWDALHTYVTGIMIQTYDSTHRFEDDDIARNYFLEAQANGFPTAPSFLPSTVDELVTILTGIIFTSTVQHASVNFPQFAHYAFVANSPLNLASPAPVPDTACEIFRFLPPKDQARRTIATGWGLSRFVLDDERFILSGVRLEGEHARERHFFNLSLANDPLYRDVCNTLEDRLSALDADITTRAPSRYGTRYLWLQPRMIPTSIAT